VCSVNHPSVVQSGVRFIPANRPMGTEFMAVELLTSLTCCRIERQKRFWGVAWLSRHLRLNHIQL
jgi:hypothetical protein